MDKKYPPTVSLMYANTMLEQGFKECRIEGNYFIVEEKDRYLIREKKFPTIPMEELDMMTYGKDYTQEQGVIFIDEKPRYSIPLLNH